MSSVDVTVNRIANFVGGETVTSPSQRTLPVTNPTTGEVIGEVPMSTAAELDEAVTRAAEAQLEWGSTPVKDRVQVLFRMKALMEAQVDRLAETIIEENGKTREEALGSILRAIECLEFASSLPQMVTGGALEVSPGVECRTTHFPLGVVAGITPFNFPLMVPLWMIPIALACGNAFVLKPSEQTPLSALELARLLDEAGVPPGVFSIVNGDREVGEAICDHPGGGDLRSPGHQGDRLCRLDHGRAGGLPARDVEPQTRPGHGRGQKPRGGGAGCRPRDDGHQRRRLGHRLRRPALHGGGSAGGGGRSRPHHRSHPRQDGGDRRRP
jgi:hypothetical protein